MDVLESMQRGIPMLSQLNIQSLSVFPQGRGSPARKTVYLVLLPTS